MSDVFKLTGPTEVSAVGDGVRVLLGTTMETTVKQRSELTDDDVVEVVPGCWMTLRECKKIAESPPPKPGTLYGMKVVIEEPAKKCRR